MLNGQRTGESPASQTSLFILPHDENLRFFKRDSNGKKVGDITISPMLEAKYEEVTENLFDLIGKKPCATALFLKSGKKEITIRLDDLKNGIELRLSPWDEDGTSIVELGNNSRQELIKTIQAWYKAPNQVQSCKRDQSTWIKQFFSLDIDAAEKKTSAPDQPIKQSNKIFIGLMLILTAIGLACSYKLWRESR